MFVGGTGARGSGPDRAPSLETNELARILLTAGQVTGPVSFTGAMPWRGRQTMKRTSNPDNQDRNENQ